jgi:hypothetical protein
MSAIEHGGPAFPFECKEWDRDDHEWKTQYVHEGMTLRDYFAAAALKGLCANSGGPIQENGGTGWGLVNCDINGVATTAYDFADAMLKARNQ